MSDDTRSDPPGEPAAAEPRAAEPALDPVPPPDQPPPPTPGEATQVRGPGPFAAIRRRITAVRVLAVVSVLLGAAVVLLGLMVFVPSLAPLKLGSARLAAQQDDSAEIARVAERFLESFLTIDYRTIDEDFERVVADTTGAFTRQMRGVRQALGEILVEAQSVSEGDVTSVDVESREGPNAVVLAEVRRTISNKNVPKPRPTRHTIQLQMVETSSGWKVESMAQVGGSGTAPLVPN